MTPYRFRQIRQRHGQTQAQWAETLGYTGKHAHNSIQRLESARTSIPGPTAKLAEMLARDWMSKESK